jgi:hypothetical protein
MWTAILFLMVLVGLLDRVDLSVRFKNQMGRKSGKRSPPRPSPVNPGEKTSIFFLLYIISF